MQKKKVGRTSAFAGVKSEVKKWSSSTHHFSSYTDVNIHFIRRIKLVNFEQWYLNGVLACMQLVKSRSILVAPWETIFACFVFYIVVDNETCVRCKRTFECMTKDVCTFIEWGGMVESMRVASTYHLSWLNKHFCCRNSVSLLCVIFFKQCNIHGR